MTNQFQNFISIIKALNNYDVDYVLVGGVAVILYGLERLTRDLVILIKPVPENIENLKKALNSIFHDESIEEISSSELNKYPVIRYGTPNGFYIDIMTKLGEAFSYEDLEYENMEYRNVRIKIATPEMLYRMKKDTVRPHDKIDASFLKEIIESRKSKN